MSQQQPEIPNGSIIITPQEVYADVKALTAEVRTLIARDQAANLPERVSRLEQRVWFASGGAAVLGALIGLAPTVFK